MSKTKIRRSFTLEKDPSTAIDQMAQELKPHDSSFTLLFISNSYDLNTLEKVISHKMGDRVVACSTAGEISAGGYSTQSMTGISFDQNQCASTILDISEIDSLDSAEYVQSLQENIVESIERHHTAVKGGKSFALLFVDGLSMKEEQVTSVLSQIVPADIPVIGGSAGDGLAFSSTQVYAQNNFKTDRATVVIVTTSLPFKVFKSQHFSTSDHKMVITSASPQKRVVYEIDGEPAAEAYARHLEVSLDEFGAELYSKHPVLLNIGGTNYVRSIQKVNDDGSLTFYCAIEEGIVLSLANKESISLSVKNLFENLKNELDQVEACILFECILRRLEVLRLDDQEKEKVISAYIKNNACGFHTYGEQFGGTHINQTITGIAFGKAL